MCGGSSGDFGVFGVYYISSMVWHDMVTHMLG